MIIFILFSLIFMIGYYFIQTILHEIGHCIVALFCEVPITGFSVFPGRMWYGEGDMSRGDLAWLYVNGILFSVLYGVFLIILIYRLMQNKYGFMMMLSISFWIGCQLYEWCRKCIQPIEEDDTYYFLLFSDLNGQTVFIVSVIISVAVFIFLCFMLFRIFKILYQNAENGKNT